MLSKIMPSKWAVVRFWGSIWGSGGGGWIAAAWCWCWRWRWFAAARNGFASSDGNGNRSGFPVWGTEAAAAATAAAAFMWLLLVGVELCGRSESLPLSSHLITKYSFLFAILYFILPNPSIPKTYKWISFHSTDYAFYAQNATELRRSEISTSRMHRNTGKFEKVLAFKSTLQQAVLELLVAKNAISSSSFCEFIFKSTNRAFHLYSMEMEWKSLNNE